MPTAKTISCPEREALASGSELAYENDSQIDALNFEAGAPLKKGVPYLILPQQNTGRKYNIPNVGERISKRFWAVEMDGENPVEARTIGISSLRGMYVSDFTEGSTAPTCSNLKKVNGYLRAQGVKYQHALEDTGWIKGNKEDMRAVVTKPVMVIVNDRGSVYVYEYDQKPDGTAGGDIKTKNNAGKVAVCGTNDRFYKFSMGSTPTDKQIKAAKEALSSFDGVYLS